MAIQTKLTLKGNDMWETLVTFLSGATPMAATVPPNPPGCFRRAPSPSEAPLPCEMVVRKPVWSDPDPRIRSARAADPAEND